MARTFLVCVLLLTLPLGATARPQSLDELGAAMKAFYELIHPILSGNEKLINALEVQQSKSVVLEIYSTAGQLITQKANLKTNIQNGHYDFNQNFELQDTVRQLSRELTRFGKQLAKVSNLNSGPLIDVAQRLAGAKIESLLKVDERS